MRLLSAVILFALGAVALRAVQLQALEHGTFAKRADRVHRESLVLKGRRGDIVDRNGNPLAISVEAYTIGAYVPLTDGHGVPLPQERVDEVAVAIVNATGEPLDTIRAKLTSETPRHVDLKRQVDPKVRAALEEQKLPGLTFIAEDKRAYPSSVAAQLIGTSNIDGKGIAGLELQYERQLAGENGEQTFVRTGDGGTLDPLSLREAKNGGRLELTLDRGIQSIAEKTADSLRRRSRAKAVTVIVLDPRNGGVLGLTSVPGPQGRPYGALTDRERNIRGITSIFEPGSTFKPLAVAAGIDQHRIRSTTQFTVPSCIRIYDRTVCDAESHPEETMTVSDIIRASSNVGTVKIVYDRLSGKGEADHGQYYAPYIDAFGFGRKTGIDLPGEVPGYVLPYAKWSGVSVANIPFGQGLSATPLQVASFYATLANGGVAVRPHLVEKIDGERVKAPGTRVVRAPVARSLTRMLSRVVSEEGTGTRAAIPGYAVAGKTGTTQRLQSDGTYSKTRYDAWFVGYAPADKPRVVVLVMAEDPRRSFDGVKGDIHGGQVAAPAFSAIAAQALKLLGVPRSPGR